MPLPPADTLQFVGNVPGVPATAPCIVLLRRLLVRDSSMSKPLQTSVLGLKSIRGRSTAAVCSTPSSSKYVAVDARVNVMRGSTVLDLAKSSNSDGRIVGKLLDRLTDRPLYAATALITAKLNTGCSVVVPPVVAKVISKLPAPTAVTWIMYLSVPLS